MFYRNFIVLILFFFVFAVIGSAQDQREDSREKRRESFHKRNKRSPPGQAGSADARIVALQRSAAPHVNYNADNFGLPHTVTHFANLTISVDDAVFGEVVIAMYGLEEPVLVQRILDANWANVSFDRLLIQALATTASLDQRFRVEGSAKNRVVHKQGSVSMPILADSSGSLTMETQLLFALSPQGYLLNERFICFGHVIAGYQNVLKRIVHVPSHLAQPAHTVRIVKAVMTPYKSDNFTAPRDFTLSSSASEEYSPVDWNKLENEFFADAQADEEKTIRLIHEERKNAGRKTTLSDVAAKRRRKAEERNARAAKHLTDVLKRESRIKELDRGHGSASLPIKDEDGLPEGKKQKPKPRRR